MKYCVCLFQNKLYPYFILKICLKSACLESPYAYDGEEDEDEDPPIVSQPEMKTAVEKASNNLWYFIIIILILFHIITSFTVKIKRSQS